MTTYALELRRRTAEIESLKQQLAAQELANEKLRQAMTTFVSRVDNGEVRSYATYNQFKELLATPSDTVALNELITKAGEVMRERCLSLREAHLVRSEETLSAFKGEK